jgi:hypothetical protein
MREHRYSLIFILTVSVLLSFCYNPHFNWLSGDKEIFRYIGRLILRGRVPYRDAFDHKPPLIYFVNAAGLLMGSWGEWFIGTSLALVATFLFFRLNVTWRFSFPWLLPLLFNLMLRDWLICLGMGMTREYTACLGLIFFCVCMGRQPYRYILLGLIGGCVFFMQQEQVMGLVPFAVYVLLPGHDTIPVSRRILGGIAGFGCIAVPLILYFAVNHALGAFWTDAFAFNFTVYTATLKESFWDHLRKLKTLFAYGCYEVPVLVGLTLGISALFFRNRNRLLTFLAVLAVPLSLINEFMGGRDPVPDVYNTGFTHYVLPLAATIPILLFCVFAFTEEPMLQGIKPQGIFGFLVCASLAHIALQHGTHLKPVANSQMPGTPEFHYLRRLNIKDNDYFAFGNTDAVYITNQLKILEASPWVYHHFWKLYATWDSDHRLLRSIIQDLRQHRTTYIHDYSVPPGWFLDPSAGEMWHDFLNENYVPVIWNIPDQAILWKLKGAP